VFEREPGQAHNLTPDAVRITRESWRESRQLLLGSPPVTHSTRSGLYIAPHTHTHLESHINWSQLKGLTFPVFCLGDPGLGSR